MPSSRKKPSVRKTSAPSIPEKSWFSAFAQAASRWAGNSVAFSAAVGLVVLWGVTGPLFGFSEAWQLFINTTTTIVTFLMVFLIQSSQNRDTLAIQVKLAELILRIPSAPNQLADAEDMSEKQLDHLHEYYKARANEKAKKSSRRRAR